MNPVLLVHGFLDTIAIFDRMTQYLTDYGWSVHRLDLVPNHGYAKLETLADQVATYIEENFESETSIDLIGFSMGGIVTRYYLQRLGGLDRVQRYINISAPNRGTLTAYSLPFTGIRQMCPRSPLLADLNQDCHQSLGRIKTTFLWTPYDLTIVPAKSTCLGVGKEIPLPVLFHAWMVRHPKVLETIRETLLEPV